VGCQVCNKKRAYFGDLEGKCRVPEAVSADANGYYQDVVVLATFWNTNCYLPSCGSQYQSAVHGVGVGAL